MGYFYRCVAAVNSSVDGGGRFSGWAVVGGTGRLDTESARYCASAFLSCGYGGVVALVWCGSLAIYPVVSKSGFAAGRHCQSIVANWHQPQAFAAMDNRCPSASRCQIHAGDLCTQAGADIGRVCCPRCAGAAVQPTRTVRRCAVCAVGAQPGVCMVGQPARTPGQNAEARQG